MKYIPLCHLKLAHAAYPEARCTHLSAAPDAATAKTLQNHRCLVRQQQDGLTLLISVLPDDTPLIPLPNGAPLRFNLQAVNAAFNLMTDLTSLQAHAAPVFSNEGVAVAPVMPLILTGRQAVAMEHHTVTTPAVAEPFALQGQPRDGALSADFTVSGLGDVVSVTSYETGPRRITLNTSAVQTGHLFGVTYSVRPQRQPGVLAEVAINFQPAMTGHSFQISFAPQETRWAYYLLTNASPDLGNFGVVDQQDAPIVFGDANRQDLVAQPDPLDRIAQNLASKHPTLRRFRFLSDTPVPSRMAGRNQIFLTLNANQVPGPLPNPPGSNFSEANLQTQDNPSKGPVLYQVIQHIS